MLKWFIVFSLFGLQLPVLGNDNNIEATLNSAAVALGAVAKDPTELYGIKKAAFLEKILREFKVSENQVKAVGWIYYLVGDSLLKKLNKNEEWENIKPFVGSFEEAHRLYQREFGGISMKRMLDMELPIFIPGLLLGTKGLVFFLGLNLYEVYVDTIISMMKSYYKRNEGEKKLIDAFVNWKAMGPKIFEELVDFFRSAMGSNKIFDDPTIRKWYNLSTYDPYDSDLTNKVNSYLEKHNHVFSESTFRAILYLYEKQADSPEVRFRRIAKILSHVWAIKDSYPRYISVVQNVLHEFVYGDSHAIFSDKEHLKQLYETTKKTDTFWYMHLFEEYAKWFCEE